jgi:hypothetical protein
MFTRFTCTTSMHTRGRTIWKLSTLRLMWQDESHLPRRNDSFDFRRTEGTSLGHTAPSGKKIRWKSQCDMFRKLSFLVARLRGWLLPAYRSPTHPPCPAVHYHFPNNCSSSSRDQAIWHRHFTPTPSICSKAPNKHLLARKALKAV